MDRKGFRRAADRQVINAPEYFRRDTPMLLEAIKDMDALIKRMNKMADTLAESPMCRRQAE